MRANYIEWREGMMKDPLSVNSRLMQSKSKYLVGTSIPKKVVGRWEKMVQTLKGFEEKKKEKDKESALASGEIRVELMTVKVSKNGLARMGVLAPASAGGDGGRWP